MSRRAGYLVALASEVLTGTDDAILGDHVRSALKSGELSVAETRSRAAPRALCRLGGCLQAQQCGDARRPGARYQGRRDQPGPR
jgi:hypothetical protein